MTCAKRDDPPTRAIGTSDIVRGRNIDHPVADSGGFTLNRGADKIDFYPHKDWTHIEPCKHSLVTRRDSRIRQRSRPSYDAAHKCTDGAAASQSRRTYGGVGEPSDRGMASYST